MDSVEDTLSVDDYDEFGLLHENAAEWSLPFDRPPIIGRGDFELADGRRLSFIKWGDEDPDVVFLHGGGQNAHTWDTVALALERPAIAIDLPGHGRSSRRDDRDYGPSRNVEALVPLLEELAPGAACVVGMSLGGATVTRLAATRPDLCRRAVIVDVTPQINDPTRSMTTMERGSVALVGGPPTYATFTEMADAAIALTPNRPASAMRRGVRHNAYRLPDGRWTWRYDLFRRSSDQAEDAQGGAGSGRGDWHDFTPLWEDVSRINVPVLLVRGGDSAYVRDEDVAEYRRRLPTVVVETVADSGHAVQSDQPLVLVRLIEQFCF
jgi:pimeloyl-ACP methyl ester carboxylesterase